MVPALNAFQPEALTAYPSMAAALAEEQLQGRLRIAPGLVATTSEVQTADMRRRMTEAWGVEPLDFYGTTEALILAAGRPFAELLEVRQYQVMHDPAGLRVAVVLREQAPAGTTARIRAALARELHDAGAVPPPIEVTPVPELPRDPGHGAKLKLIRNAAAPA